jgi:hypothetical protein
MAAKIALLDRESCALALLGEIYAPFSGCVVVLYLGTQQSKIPPDVRLPAKRHKRPG